MSFFLIWEPQIDAKQKKRKLPDASSKPGPPAKKSAVSVASSLRPSVVVKKEGRSSTTTTVAATTTTMKESKSDSSFFSAPKQKPKLPTFKKAPAGVTAPTTAKKEPPANVAQPSSTDAFQEALKDMARARKPSPAAPGTSSNTEAVSSAVMVGAKLLKKKKSVTWAPDGQLELVKLIERAVYDDDPIDVSLFLSIIVQYINYVPLLLIYRVRHTHCTMYVNWTEGKEPLCMPTYSRSFSIGPSHNVSIAQMAPSEAALTPRFISHRHSRGH
jgi:hypothetical protein